jgi:hypothetical protein
MVRIICFCFRKQPLMAAEWLDMALGLARAGGGSLHTYPITPPTTRLPRGPTCLASNGLRPIESLFYLSAHCSLSLTSSFTEPEHHRAHVVCQSQQHSKSPTLPGVLSSTLRLLLCASRCLPGTRSAKLWTTLIHNSSTLVPSLAIPLDRQLRYSGTEFYLPSPSDLLCGLVISWQSGSPGHWEI